MASICGTTLYNITSSTNIYNPNYPEKYHPNTICTYTIKNIRTTSSYILRLFFLSNILLPGGSMPECTEDYLEITVGSGVNRKYLGRYCGTEEPPVINTPSADITLKFYSTVSSTGGTFTAKALTPSYVSPSCPATTQETKYHKNGYLYSPFYPKGYGKNKVCTTKMIVGSGNRIELKFLDISLYQINDTDCDESSGNDYIQIRGTNINSVTFDSATTIGGMERRCGSTDGLITIPSDYVYVYIKFRSYHETYNSQGSNYRGYYMVYSVYALDKESATITTTPTTSNYASSKTNDEKGSVNAAVIYYVLLAIILIIVIPGGIGIGIFKKKKAIRLLKAQREQQTQQEKNTVVQPEPRPTALPKEECPEFDAYPQPSAAYLPPPYESLTPVGY